MAAILDLKKSQARYTHWFWVLDIMYLTKMQ